MPRAAVLPAFGAPYVVEDVALDAPQAGEVRVRLEACAICHSDVAYGDGAWGGTAPVVLGHEACGVVEQTGPAVALRTGDRVAVSLIRHCGACPRCLEGEPALCAAHFRLDYESPIRLTSGERISQGLRCGAFAEEVLVHASQAVRIPGDVPAVSAALIGCAVLTGTGAARHTAKLAPGSSVVVIGAGGVGLNAIQGAALAGAGRIVAVDIAEPKLRAAQAFGATHLIDGTANGTADAIRDAAGGEGADAAIVAAGTAAAVNLGLACLRRGGTLVLVGMPGTGDHASIDPTQIAHDGLRILGSKLGSSDPRVDVPELCGLYAEGRLKLDELVTATYPLDEINEAIDAMRRGEALRNVIVFG
jgi:S-(hydroxymethyl)glutathione dehydrogenase / alcohol dehydrogenase